MFQTWVGPKQGEENIAYLRPETAQLIFADFKQVVDTGRVKLPFGIAQMGKAFRNEISPRNFLFRCREFEQMEIEYFIHPDMLNDCPYIGEVVDHRMLIWSSQAQKADQPEEEMSIKEALDKKIIKTPWHAYWLAMAHNWFVGLGCKPENFRIRQHVADELSHYSSDTWDLEYKFPFGWKELQGLANRRDFDLQQHIKFSGKQLTVFDDATKKHIVPHVVCEPSQGVDRAFLVFLFDAYSTDPERDNNVVLRLHSALAPVKVGVFPLVNKHSATPQNS
jgi:glycyl-tRNA synthetase